MINQSRYAVFLDIDGTILNPLHPNGLSPVLCRVLSDMQKKGHLFFINTGRSPGYFVRTEIPREKFDGICAGIGSYAELHGEVLYTKPISDSVVRDIIAYCAAHDETCFIESDEDGSDGRYSFRDGGTFHARRHWDNPEEFFRAARGRTFYKITVPYLPSPEYRAFLEQYFSMIYCSAVKETSEIRGEPAYAEGALIGCDKGYAVRKVCALLNIPIEHSVAIGDSENDLGMLHAAGISVAMGNAPEEVKKACTFVTESVAKDGAARAIVRLLAKESETEYF